MELERRPEKEEALSRKIEEVLQRAEKKQKLTSGMRCALFSVLSTTEGVRALQEHLGIFSMEILVSSSSSWKTNTGRFIVNLFLDADFISQNKCSSWRKALLDFLNQLASFNRNLLGCILQTALTLLSRKRSTELGLGILQILAVLPETRDLLEKLLKNTAPYCLSETAPNYIQGLSFLAQSFPKSGLICADIVFSLVNQIEEYFSVETDNDMKQKIDSLLVAASQCLGQLLKERTEETIEIFQSLLPVLSNSVLSMGRFASFLMFLLSAGNPLFHDIIIGHLFEEASKEKMPREFSLFCSYIADFVARKKDVLEKEIETICDCLLLLPQDKKNFLAPALNSVLYILAFHPYKNEKLYETIRNKAQETKLNQKSFTFFLKKHPHAALSCPTTFEKNTLLEFFPLEQPTNLPSFWKIVSHDYQLFQ